MTTKTKTNNYWCLNRRCPIETVNATLTIGVGVSDEVLTQDLLTCPACGEQCLEREDS